MYVGYLFSYEESYRHTTNIKVCVSAHVENYIKFYNVQVFVNDVLHVFTKSISLVVSVNISNVFINLNYLM